MCNSLADTHVIVYVDHILIGGATEEEHDRELEEVLTRLSRMQIHVNPDKVCLGRKQVMYLGLDVWEEGCGLQTYVDTQREKAPTMSSIT